MQHRSPDKTGHQFVNRVHSLGSSGSGGAGPVVHTLVPAFRSLISTDFEYVKFSSAFDEYVVRALSLMPHCGNINWETCRAREATRFDLVQTERALFGRKKPSRTATQVGSLDFG